MNEKFEELYSYLKGEDATDLSAEEFYAAYSNDPSKARDVYAFVKGEQMTDLTEEDFFSAYFGDVKKKVVSEQPSTEEPLTPLVQEEEVMVSESPTPDGESVVTETEVVEEQPAPVVPETVSQEEFESTESDTAIERALGKNVVTDLFGDLYRAGAAGQAQGGSVDEALELFAKNSNASKEDIEDFILAQKRMQALGESDEMRDFQKIYQENDGGVLGFIKGVASNPTVIPQLFVSSVSAMLTPATLAGAGTGAAAGALVGGPAGALVGAMGMAGTTLETGLTYAELLQEELGDEEMTVDNIRKILENQEKMNNIRFKAVGRGLTIGAVDAISGGIAGKVTTSVAKATGRKILAATAGGAVEAVGGSAGEVAGKLVAGQEMDFADIAFEGVTGTATAPLSVGYGLYKSPKYYINGTGNEAKVSGPTMAKFIREAPIETIEKAKVDIVNDPELKALYDERYKNSMLESKVKKDLEQAGISNEEKIKELTPLEIERQKLKDNNTEAGKQKLKEINKKIEEVTNAPIVEDVVATEEVVEERGFFGKILDKVFKKEKIDEDAQLTEEQKEQGIQEFYDEGVKREDAFMKRYEAEGDTFLAELQREELEKIKSESPTQYLERKLEFYKRAPQYTYDGVKEGRRTDIYNKEEAQEETDRLYQLEKLLGITATEQEVKARQELVDSIPTRAELERQKETAPTEEAPVYEEPTKVTSPTPEKFATVNRNDGKGTVTLTEAEYNTEMERFAPAEEVVAPSEEITQKREESRDEVVLELQKAREELGIYVDDQLFEGISEDTENAVDKLDNGEQLTWAQAEKASKELYDKYNEIAAMKNDPNRMHTTEQIDNMLDFLGQEINNLETYIQNEQANIEGETGIESVTETETTEEVSTTQEKITDDAIQEPSTETVDVQEPATDGGPMGEGDITGEVTEAVEAEVETPAAEGEAEGQPLTEEQEAQIAQELSDLENELDVDEDVQFQLETDMTNEERRDALKKQAEDLMNDVQPENVETVDQPSPAKVITVTVKENTALADKVKSVGLDFLVGKQINLVMADQLKVDDKRMGGPFFPLMDGLYGKVAWASMDNKAAGSIVNGAIKSDYSVVFNMSPDAIDSNSIMGETLMELLSDLNAEEQADVFSLMKENVLKGKAEAFKRVRNVFETSTTLAEALTLLQDLTVDERAALIKKVVPSESVSAGTEIGKALQKNGITIEKMRAINSEQFVSDLPMGALTMVLEVTDKQGNKVTEKTKGEAIISPEQQKKEGLPHHPNYEIYVRGRAVALLNETTSFWNVIPSYKEIVDLKLAGLIKSRDVYTVKGGSAFVLENPNGTRTVTFKDTSGSEVGDPVTIPATNKKSNKQIVEKLFGKADQRKKPKKYTAKQAKAGAYSSAMKGASRAEVVIEPTKSLYERFIERLSKAFPSVEVVTSQAEFDALVANARAKQLVTRKKQKVYGAVYQGKLYLNPEIESLNTPVHEFGHIWLNVARELGKDTYKRGMELMTEDSPYYQQVINSKEYGAIIKKMKKDGATKADIEAYIKEEALATAIGDKGESFASAAQEKNFKNWLNELFEFVKKLTGISDLTAEQLQDIGLDEFLQGVVVDIMSENEVFLGAEVKSFGEQLQLMTAPDISMQNIVQFGRSEGRSDAAIKELLKKRGFKVADINEAMVVNVDLTTKLPLEFGRVEGGVQKAEQLFTEVRDKLSKFAKGKRKKIPAKKLTKDEMAAKVRELRLQNPSLFNLSDAALLKKFPETTRYETLEAPTMGEVRAKALELLRENPIFKEQKEGVQLGLLTSFDRAVGTKANKTVQQEVNAIKNNIKQRKKGIKSIKEAQRELRKALKGLPLTPEVRAIIKAVGDINEDNSLAVIEKISEAVDKMQVKDAISNEKKKALKDVIRSLKDDAKYLSTIKKTIARFMRKSLPISNVYSKSQLAKAVSVLTNINAKNYVAEAMRALDIVNEQREKMKNAVIKDMFKLAQAKAKKERGQSTKPKSKGLDAQGQAFFQEAAKVLKLVYKNDIIGLIAMQELIASDKVEAIILKEERGEKLTVKEQALINKVAAFETFAELRVMTLEDVINMSQSLKDVRSESIARLKANRLKRAQEMEALSTESVSQIKKGFKELFTIAGVLKNDKQLDESAASIREEFKRGGVTKAAKALVKKIVGGIDKINIAARVKDMVVENIVHLGTIMTILDKGGTFFTDNIYRPLNLMNENSRKGYRSQMQKLDNIANSISGITKGYTQIRNMIADGKLFIEGLDAEGVDADIEALKIDLEDGRLPKIEDVKRRLKALVKARMEYMGKSPKSIQEAFSAVDSQTDVDALVDSTLTFIEDVSEGYVVKGVTLTKNQMLRVYALSKNAVQREKLRGQGLTDESLAKIEEFLGPQLLEFADATVDYLSNEYFESVNDVYSQTNDVNLDYIDNYFPTKSISKTKEKTFDSDSFEARFDAESPSAIKQRSDEVSGVDLNYDFVTELNNHLNSMERFKAYAEGVKKIAKILALPQVASLLKQSGFAKMTNLMIDNEVNPYKTETTNVGKVLNAFYGIALGFKWMQLPKQMTSFVNAYSQYSYGKEGSTLKKVGTLGPDFLGFVGDIVQLVAMFRTNFSKARGMSSTFNDRVLDALQGNISALEGGVADQTVRGGFNRWWQVAKASPTTVGDILGVMGYMAVYNRNIKNGMSEAKALELFNDYNKTQQTRRGTELNSLQVSAKQKPMLRLLTAFSSTLFLQTNEIIKGVVNINRDLGAGKMPKKSDVRSVYLNMGVANAAFIAAANIFRIIQGDDDDREDVLYEMGKSMVMVNQLSKIPLYGAAGQDLLNTLEGNRWKSTGPVAPATDLLRDGMKAYSNKDIIEAAIVATEIGTKTNLDMVRGARIAAEGGDAWEATYKLFGVGTSYQPQGDSGSTNWLKGEDSAERKGVMK